MSKLIIQLFVLHVFIISLQEICRILCNEVSFVYLFASLYNNVGRFQNRRIDFFLRYVRKNLLQVE